MTFPTELERLLKEATEGPWCAESCGEKGDGSNIIGVAFHPDDTDAERPLAGWLQEWDESGNVIDYYRDEQIAELEHRSRNSAANTSLILLLRNHADAILGLVRAAKGLSHGEDWNNGTHAKTHGYRRKLLEALAKLNGGNG